MPNLRLAGDPATDALLDANPFALLVGMLLDQHDRIGKADMPRWSLGRAGAKR